MIPEFTAPLSDVLTDEGDDVCLRCMVTGIPEPTVEWRCDGNVSQTTGLSNSVFFSSAKYVYS